ncbi:MAG: LysR substrate-binding domain-containing protein [Formosimonas sp.]|jgi:LysR family glycine cleavage system transcriptional activator
MNTVNKLPQLNALKTFETVSRHLSMVSAARELCLTHGAVSRQIAQLESQLDLKLFVRRNRAIFLTREGVQLQETCVAVFAQLSDAVASIRSTKAAAPLVLSCEPTIAMRWLIARLPRFTTLHPEIPLHLFTAGGAVRFAEQGVDLAIRRDDFAMDVGLDVRTLAAEKMGVVCSPILMAQANGLLNVTRLMTQTRSNAWRDWVSLTGVVSFNLDAPAQVFEHFYLSLEAAGAGLGAAIASQYMVEQDLRDGRLVAPFGFVADGSSYCLLSNTPIDADERKRVFLDWLRGEFLESACLHER